MSESEWPEKKPFSVFYDEQDEKYYIYVPDGCLTVDGENVTFADRDTETENVQLNIDEDASEVWCAVVDGEATFSDAKSDDADFSFIVCRFEEEDNDGRDCRMLCSSVHLRSEHAETAVDDLSIEEHVPAQGGKEHAIKGWHTRPAEATKLSDMLTAAEEVIAKELVLRNSTGGALHYIPIGRIVIGDGKLIFVKKDGTEIARFSANHNGNDVVVTIPDEVTPGNGKLVIKYGTATKGEFTANQSGNTEVVIPEPTIPEPPTVNDGKLKVKFGTDSAVEKFSANTANDATLEFAKVALTGAYGDLSGRPTIPTIPDIVVDASGVTSGQAIGGLAVDATNKHKLVATGVAVPKTPQGGISFVGDIRYDITTMQLQKRTDTWNPATGVVTQGAWTMIAGGQAVPHPSDT